jgi:hypothetical protein
MNYVDTLLFFVSNDNPVLDPDEADVVIEKKKSLFSFLWL